jgi:hypothetical protein
MEKHRKLMASKKGVNWVMANRRKGYSIINNELKFVDCCIKQSPPHRCVPELKGHAATRLGIPIFGSDFWDPHWRWNSDSVYDSEDSGRIFFLKF